MGDEVRKYILISRPPFRQDMEVLGVVYCKFGRNMMKDDEIIRQVTACFQKRDRAVAGRREQQQMADKQKESCDSREEQESGDRRGLRPARRLRAELLQPAFGRRSSRASADAMIGNT